MHFLDSGVRGTLSLGVEGQEPVNYFNESSIRIYVDSRVEKSLMVQIRFTPFPELATARFRLRQLTKDDENEIFVLRSDDFINQYLDRPKANTLDDARNFISKITNGTAKNEAIFWVVTPKDDARFLGTICLWNISREEEKAEIGYELLPENHGKGIMQEVIPEVIRFALEEIRLHSIEAELSPRNVKSVKLLEKNGFTIKTEFNNGNPDSVIYVLENSGREKDR